MALEHGQRGSTLLLHITGNKLACNFMILLSNILKVLKKKKTLTVARLNVSDPLDNCIKPIKYI